MRLAPIDVDGVAVPLCVGDHDAVDEPVMLVVCEGVGRWLGDCVVVSEGEEVGDGVPVIEDVSV